MHHLYWFNENEFNNAKVLLKESGYSLSATILTPCQVMRAQGKKVVYAPPSVWSRMCIRQGSWYRDSEKKGMTMLMSEDRLPELLDGNLEATLEMSDFQPKSLPNEETLQAVADSQVYKDSKPDSWERTSWWDHVSLKMFFGLFRFWKWGENFKTYWTSHKANHANFVSKAITTEIDGEAVAYSLTENKGVCSSCVEFFNIVNPDSRKLVRSCPGSIVFGGAPRDKYVDVKVAV